MMQTIAFEPGGVELNVVEMDGAIDFSLRLKLVLLTASVFTPPRLRVGPDPDPPEGMVYVPPVFDQFFVPELPELFSVAGYDGDDPQ